MSTKWIALWKIYSITCTHILKLLHTCYFYQSLHTFASLIVLNTASKNRLINWVQSQFSFTIPKFLIVKCPSYLSSWRIWKIMSDFPHQKSLSEIHFYSCHSNDCLGQKESKEMTEILDFPLSLPWIVLLGRYDYFCFKLSKSDGNGNLGQSFISLSERLAMGFRLWSENQNRNQWKKCRN